MATSILLACCIRRLCYSHRSFHGIATGIPLAFKVCRCEPEFITPARPTPREYKLLSDIDDQRGLRDYFPIIQFYRYNPSMRGKDPVEIIREALAKVLVPYYPFAGRLREGDNGKFLVDCNAEGVMFIKADADVTLEQFGNKLQPPFPCFDELLYDVLKHSPQGMLNSPLLLIQVTRLKCGGFIFAIRFNHVMCDGTGIKQFMTAMGEMAQGADACSISPVWERHLLDAGDPPQVTFSHPEYDKVGASRTITWPSDDLVERSFFFGHDEISALRSLLPLHLCHCTTKFELLAASLWRCRTIALNLEPEEKVRVTFSVNLRPRFNPSLPSGYYGNAMVLAIAITTVRNLVHNPLGYAVELVKQAKASATKEYANSVAALMVISRKQLHLPVVAESFVFSDVTKVGFEDVDFGWGKAVFAGPAKAIDEISFLIAAKSKEGEAETLVSICLPGVAMERFDKELNSMLVVHS